MLSRSELQHYMIWTPREVNWGYGNIANKVHCSKYAPKISFQHYGMTKKIASKVKFSIIEATFAQKKAAL